MQAPVGNGPCDSVLLIAYDEAMVYKPMHANDLITAHFRLIDAQKKALAKLGLVTLLDLLYHLPLRHMDAGKSSPIERASGGERVTIYGKIEKTGTKKSFHGHVPMGEATLRDSTGTIKLVWFNQAYMAKMVVPGDVVRASGTVAVRKGGTSLVNPEIEKIAELPGDGSPSLFEEGGIDPDDRFMPVYPESKGITSRWIYHTIKKIIASGLLSTLSDPIAPDILTHYSLPSLSTALIWIHTPHEERHALSARKRFAFEEIFYIQLERQGARMRYEQNPTFLITPDQTKVDAFVRQLGFPLTDAQKKAVDTIFADFSSSRAMLRLLEGDVGSGKTAVAAATTYAAVTTRPQGQNYGALQVAYMCPTEILATQHFESFIKYFVGTGMNIGLITGSGCRKFPSKVDPSGWTDISRTQFLKWVASGELPIVIGTHALIQKSLSWKHLAYVIIDEQHRFGTKQRAMLVQKDARDGARAPHFLSMTATPIPRTLALTLYGDLDLTILDQMPSGRKPVITKIVPPGGRDAVYEHIRSEIKAGRQAYVICPRIDEPDPEKEQAIIAKSVNEEATRLQEKIFPEFQIDVLHSKMKPSEKDDVMELFAKGDTDILVATSVVEVGVNVPNATLIVIEGAERFGLAQLHQLRGRVLRGTHQAYCYLFSETKTQKTFDRLKALTEAKNGFELSEMDLALRGAGELGGGKQWGLSDLGMEAIKNLKMVEAARDEAKRILTLDLDLANSPLLKAKLDDRTRKHFE
jgi:ATP-dependent DNA helicase RecG